VAQVELEKVQIFLDQQFSMPVVVAVEHILDLGARAQGLPPAEMAAEGQPVHVKLLEKVRAIQVPQEQMEEAVAVAVDQCTRAVQIMRMAEMEGQALLLSGLMQILRQLLLDQIVQPD
jgi:predicted nucleotidyltransferase